MMNISLRFEGYVEKIIDEAVKQGVVKTKAEALRFGLLELNDKYGLVPPISSLETINDIAEIERIQARVKSGKEEIHKVEDINDIFK